MNDRFKHLLVNVAVFLAVYLVIFTLLPIQNYKLDIHGAGWVVAIGSCLGASYLRSFLIGFFKKSWEENVEIGPVATYVLKEVTSWLCIAAGFAFACWLTPSLVSVAPLSALFLTWGAIGLASAIANLISLRLGYRSL